MTTKLKLQIFATVIGMAGLGLIAWFSNFWVSAGVLLALWGNNIERRIGRSN